MATWLDCFQIIAMPQVLILKEIPIFAFKFTQNEAYF